MQIRFLAVIILFLAFVSGCGHEETPFETPNPPVFQRAPGSIGLSGNPRDTVVDALPGGVLLAGGSVDVDQAMLWLVQRALGGDLVVLRATGGTGYNEYLYRMGGVHSVETFLVNTRALADDSLLAARIREAEAVFIAGGDQSDYIRLWKNAKLHHALLFLIHQKKAAIGGTSAGCAILGEYIYTAEQGSVTSTEALSNPFHEMITLQSGDLLGIPLLKNVITDQHYSERERLGRHVVFMARLFNGLPVRGIGVDERTAVAIDSLGNARVFGSGFVWFWDTGAIGPTILKAGVPLDWSGNDVALKVFRVQGSQHGTSKFDVNLWKPELGVGITQFRASVRNGNLHLVE